MTVERRKRFMKNDLYWTKTILTVYRYLERICGGIDKIIMQKALGCSNIVGQNYFQNNTLSVSQKIIDLSERKVTLINLKVLIEQSLSAISQKDAQVLIEKYVDGTKNKDLAENMGVGLRTIFRKIESAEMAFKSKICLKGYNDIKLCDMLKNESWIKNVYNSIANKKDDFQMTNVEFSRAVSI